MARDFNTWLNEESPWANWLDRVLKANDLYDDPSNANVYPEPGMRQIGRGGKYRVTVKHEISGDTVSGMFDYAYNDKVARYGRGGEPSGGFKPTSTMEDRPGSRLPRVPVPGQGGDRGKNKRTNVPPCAFDVWYTGKLLNDVFKKWPLLNFLKGWGEADYRKFEPFKRMFNRLDIKPVTVNTPDKNMQKKKIKDPDKYITQYVPKTKRAKKLVEKMDVILNTSPVDEAELKKLQQELKDLYEQGEYEMRQKKQEGKEREEITEYWDVTGQGEYALYPAIYEIINPLTDKEKRVSKLGIVKQKNGTDYDKNYTTDYVGHINFVKGPQCCMDAFIVAGEVSNRIPWANNNVSNERLTPRPRQFSKGSDHKPDSGEYYIMYGGMFTTEHCELRTVGNAVMSSYPYTWATVFMHKDNKWPVPGEFIGMCVYNTVTPRQYPWFYQGSMPFMFSGHYFETTFYTSAIIYSREDGAVEGDYTYTIFWRMKKYKGVSSTDWKKYSVGDRVAIIRNVGSNNPTYSTFELIEKYGTKVSTTSEETEDAGVFLGGLIAPITFYK